MRPHLAGFALAGCGLGVVPLQVCLRRYLPARLTRWVVRSSRELLAAAVGAGVVHIANVQL